MGRELSQKTGLNPPQKRRAKPEWASNAENRRAGSRARGMNAAGKLHFSLYFYRLGR